MLSLLLKKTKISARVKITLKNIEDDSAFTHKDVWEFGAKLIAIGDEEEKYSLLGEIEQGLPKRSHGISRKYCSISK